MVKMNLTFIFMR